ncbi:uncharacterized protein SRS1_15420 [Sporisorium reilianum f. sp. reilianum]|uniref:Phosphatidylinositol N-acetylglucosaminyltransferase n=1 Tax=Sporisorium reilianum f. sp. reilianum TaxID=72559 RepID=A0A2N8UJE8_9BASI|nr:uncharacterized protein SRS1_15420 [Sporisorium reilianum f. sp. reilianum]
MSAPPGRSATVTSLSGRVNALKFMQRASPSSTPTKPTASTSRTPLASPSPATPASLAPSLPGSPFAGATADEEQWSLSPAAIARLRARAAGSGNVGKGPTISQDAGFDAWLISQEAPKEVKEGKASQRQTFGKLGKLKQEGDEEQLDSKKRSRGSNDAEEGLEPDFESEESEEEKPKGFVKPGSLKKSKKGGKQESPSAKKAKKNGAGKDQDKVVFARKRGGKLGISGGVLWRKQPFADDFVPPSFLSDLRTNSQVVLPTLSELVHASLRISTRFLCVCLFALLFVHLHLGTIDAEMLLLAALVTFVVLTLFTSASGTAREGGSGRRKAVGGVLSKTIMALVLLAVSPVLRTLTESTTSDSIWALAVALFALHLALADYSATKPKQLSATLSFNAALSASVVLASRLHTDTECFALLVLAVLLFAPTPNPHDAGTQTSRSSKGQVLRFSAVYVACMGAAALCGGGEAWWWMVVAWMNVVVGFVSVVCPCWIVWAQRWKMEIKGPWDPAEPVLSSTGALRM